jgi:CBS domain-containing membrane protein
LGIDIDMASDRTRTRLRRYTRVAWRALLPPPIAMGRREKLRVVCGAIFGIFATGLLTMLLFPEKLSLVAYLVAPMGASAVLLFAAPASPLAQPWPVLGGNLVSVLIGVTCAQWLMQPLLASALAVGLSIAAMLLLRCLHPPGGAIALMAVLGGADVHAAGYGLLWYPVGVNCVLLLLLAVFFHNATRHRYPHSLQHTRVAQPVVPLLRITREDLEASLAEEEELLDITVDDLDVLLRRAENHALSRRASAVSAASSSKRTSRRRFNTSLR